MRAAHSKKASTCLTLNEPYVSGVHAELRWGGQAWELKDRGSRNGTYLDGRRIQPGVAYAIEAGARIGFGRVGRDWELTDDSAPVAMAVPLDAASGLSAGLGGQARDTSLFFSVSQDEEYVHLRMTCGIRDFDMGARQHNYLLLTLGRRRLSEASEGLPEASCGWIDQEELSHDPSMAPPLLNCHVFRIRQQFAKAGVVDAASIVERRPRPWQLRVGTARISIATL